jgi:hypothetical protein
MPTPKVLDERLPRDDHLGASVLLEPTHRSQSCLQPAVIGLNSVVGVLLGAVPCRRQKRLQHRRGHCCIERSPRATTSTSLLKRRQIIGTVEWFDPFLAPCYEGEPPLYWLPRHIPAQCNSAGPSHATCAYSWISPPRRLVVRPSQAAPGQRARWARVAAPAPRRGVGGGRCNGRHTRPLAPMPVT